MQQNSGNPPQQRTQPQNEEQLPPAIPFRIWVFGGIAFVLFLFLSNIISLYTDWLWFQAVGYTEIFTTELTTKIIVFFVMALIFAFLFWINTQVARWQVKRNTLFFSDEALVAQRVTTYAVWIVIVILGWMVGTTASSNWLIILQYLNQVPFGEIDPIFGRDVGFYVFSLPLLNFVQGWLVVVLFLSLLGAGGIYLLEQRNNLEEGRIIILPYVQLHLLVLGALIFLAFGWGYWLDAFDLMYSDRGVVFGASYTDISVMLPVLRIMLGISILAALVMIVNIFVRRNVLPLAIIFVWLIGGFILRGIVPGLVQRFVVEPNELTRETPYIEHNIAFTNKAYNLDKIDERPFDNFQPLSAADLEANTATLENIRLWDYRPLQTTFNQLQALRLYYSFEDVDLDRYVINGELRQVNLSARELDKGQLQSPTWINQKLQFTHGYGVVMNPINEFTADGLPNLWIKDLPPQSSVDVEVSQPAIYYGEHTDDYVFVNTLEDEFDFQGDEGAVYTTYEGQGGVRLNSYFKRLFFTLSLGDTNILLSSDITNDSRVLLNRDIRERAFEIAPFLSYDADPYIVIGNDGHLYWMIDAYTISGRYPYSEPAAGQRFNYIRNSVKVVIDAYDGTVSYYLADETDPLAQTLAQIFPNLLLPGNEMPAGLVNHWRYPEDLFRIQSRLYQIYHMRDPKVFYNQEDLWAIPQENLAGSPQPVEPYYVVARLPGEDIDEFMMIQPFTPHNKDNLVAWMSALSDGENYGKVVVYSFPKQELIFGPLQIEGRIDQDPEISAQFSLWNQGGSSVQRGNLLVLPLGDSVLYVEPIYLQAESGRIPELKRVIVASEDNVIMAPTLAEGLTELLGSIPQAVVESTAASGGEADDDQSNTNTTNASTDTIEVSGTARELAESASAHYEAAQEALKEGDWATYGDELEALEEDLQSLLSALESE
ncbi:MAG: UPF0182 family protein [Chloroflexota bacterium]